MYSRPVQHILDETKRLIDAGVSVQRKRGDAEEAPPGDQASESRDARPGGQASESRPQR